MYIYVSWAYLDAAERVAKSQSKAKTAKGKPTETSPVKPLPEYQKYLEALESKKGVVPSADANLLAIWFVVPSLGEVQLFELSSRVTGDKKLSVAVSARNWLVSTFSKVWNNDLSAPKSIPISFVGLHGLHDFFHNWAMACAAHGQPLPLDLWQASPKYELFADDKLLSFLENCAELQSTKEDKDKYQEIISKWSETGASAEIDSYILLTSALRLGFGDNQNGGKSAN
jgi:hypothetical protein